MKSTDTADEADTLTAMAKRMGMTVSDVADAKPWPPEAVAAYAEKHGRRSDPIGYQHLPDVQVASAVRMLMRNDLDHEGVVCAARDRICALHVEKAALLSAAQAVVKARADYVSWVQGGQAGRAILAALGVTSEADLRNQSEAAFASLEAAIARAEGRGQ